MDERKNGNNNTFLIGVDLGGTNVRAGLINNGKVIKYHKAGVPHSLNDPAPVIGAIIDTIKEVFIPEVIGIGIGVPGLIDKEKEYIHSVINIPSFKTIELKSILTQYFKVPTFIKNDVNCFALGEKYFGAGRPYRNMVGLSIGTGLGVGIISGNKLFEDANNGSGEFGEIPYLKSTFESYCSGQFFKNKLGVSGAKAFELAKNGNQTAFKAFKEMGSHLGKVLKIVILTLDPQAIIIGGSVARAKDYFHSSMIKELNTLVFKETLKKIDIKYAEQEHSPILGASKLITLSKVNQPVSK